MAAIDFDAIRREWDEHAAGEEEWTKSPSVNRSLRWREIDRCTDPARGVRTILDVGGATGAFSIPLARRGFEVTHVDISPAMLDIARGKVEASPIRGSGSIRFIEGNAADLSAFADRSFDVVLNMDGPLSGSGPEADRVLRESCRVTRRTLIVSAAHKAWVATSRRRDGKSRDGIRAFTASELRRFIENNGLHVERASGMGSLAHLCGNAYVQELVASGDSGAFEAFVDECEHFDRHISPDGPGSNDDTGLFAIARRI
ncbi:class I SAM-dependent methyltransferase [Pendulispora brunnea]|uniref:Class I SAM-dependent methyltransferase n=1 Tax=Pendulispora brunnea TaxID=2905690 RepID=A0ABZ2KMY5_9BACT